MYCNFLAYILVAFSAGILIGLFVPAIFLVWILALVLIAAGLIFMNN